MMLPPSQPLRHIPSPDSEPIGRNRISGRGAPRSNEEFLSFVDYVKSRHDDIYDARFWLEVRAYACIPNSIRDRYMGQFVAVYMGNIVDNDPDEAVLIDRFYRAFGYVPVLIHWVGVEDGVVDMLEGGV